MLQVQLRPVMPANFFIFMTISLLSSEKCELVFGICPNCLKSKEKITIREASLRVGLTAEGAEKRLKKILKQLKEDFQKQL